MQTTVLLSIKPEFADKIFAGTKRYEFRRVLFKSKSVSKVVVYASSPVQRVIGEFEIEEILESNKTDLWESTKDFAGIEKFYFDQYFDDCTTASAIKIKRPRRYPNPLKLEHICNVKNPPQSFMYLEPKWDPVHPTIGVPITQVRIALPGQNWEIHAAKYMPQC